MIEPISTADVALRNVIFLKMLVPIITLARPMTIALRNFEPQAMKLITAVLFLVILVISMERTKKVNKNA